MTFSCCIQRCSIFSCSGMNTPSSGLRAVSRSLLNGHINESAKKTHGKTLGIEIVGHHGAVRHRGLDVELVENRVEVGGAGKLLFEFRLLVEQPFRMLGREIRIGISEQRLGGHGEFHDYRRACAAVRWRWEARPWRRHRDRRRSQGGRGDRRRGSFRSVAAAAGRSAERRGRGRAGLVRSRA